MDQGLREFQIFVKPVGSECNLGCSYCYYLGKKGMFPYSGHPVMDDITLEKYIVQHIEASTGTIITFSWHGGEPLLAGIDFYRQVLHLQSIYKQSGTTIINAIQTNGTLINKEWSRFFAVHDFRIGISMDGSDELHNLYRRTKDNKATSTNVKLGFQLLMEQGINPEILCVVNAENVRFPQIIYNFFKQTGAAYITFLPLVEPEPGSPTGVSKRSVPAEEFGTFLSEIFDEWVEKDIGKIKIQIFEEASRTAFNQEHTLCIFKLNCGGVPVIEKNGNFYSCDHYVNREHLLGNINDHSLLYFLESEKQKAFGMAKSETLPQFCLECEVRSMCNGECPKNRFIITPDGQPGLNYLCPGYKYFFNHCRPFVEAIRTEWEKSDLTS